MIGPISSSDRPELGGDNLWQRSLSLKARRDSDSAMQIVVEKLPKGARIGARHRVRRKVDASKQGARIGARHRVRRQVDASTQGARIGPNRVPESVPGTGCDARSVRLPRCPEFRWNPHVVGAF